MFKNLILSIVIILLFSACFGNNKKSSSEIQTGMFIDGLVSGLKYTNGKNIGYTDLNGNFEYRNGLIEFFIGNIKIGELNSLPSDGYVFIQDIIGVERTDTSNSKVLKIASFLQSLDSNILTDEIEILKLDFDKFNDFDAHINDLDVSKILLTVGITPIGDDLKVKRHLDNILRLYEIIDDNTIPEVKSSTIFNNSINVSIDTNIKILFSEDIQKKSINNNTVILKDADDTIIDFDISHHFNELILYPKNNLLNGMKYRLLLKTDILDFEGYSLKNVSNKNFETISFTTVDIIPPVLNSSDKIFNLNIGDKIVLENVSGTDNIDVNILVSKKGEVDFNTIGTYLLTYTARDSSYNTTSITHTYIVKDTSAPKISSSSQTFITTVGLPLVIDHITASDNSDSNIIVSKTGEVDFNSIGTYFLIYTAIDSSLNSAFITHKYIVQDLPDTSKPILSSIDKTFVTTVGTPLTLEVVTASDNKDLSVTVVQSGSVDFNTIGTYLITYTSTDVALNSSSITHTYEVNDIEYLSNFSESRDYISHYDTSGSTWDMKLSNDGSKVYLADGSRGLIIMDVSDISNPIELGSYNTSGSSRSVALSSDGLKAYIADGSNGLVIIDITDSSNPIELNSYDTSGSSYDIELSSDGSKVFLADGTKGLVIIDISDINNLIELGSFDTSSTSYALTLSNDGFTAYVADHTSGLVILDITDTSNPSEITTYNTSASARGIVLSNDNTKAYISDTSGLVILDISTVNSPLELSTFSVWGADPYHTTLSSDGLRAYISDKSKGLFVLDISDSTNPVEIGSFVSAGDAYSSALSIDDKKLYLADYSNGLVIYDIKELSNSFNLSTIDTSGSTRGIKLSSDSTKAYLADGSRGLIIMDITNSLSPSVLGSYNTSGNAYDLRLSSDEQIAYVADGTNGLVIVDISNSSLPAEIASYNTIGTSYDVALSNNDLRAYIADGSNGLVVVDISDNTTPFELGSYDTSETTYGVELSFDNTKAYLADGHGGLLITDISDDNNPSFIDGYNTSGVTYDLSLSFDDTKAYLADSSRGLIIVDIEDSINPLLLGSYNTASSAQSVIVTPDDSKAYVADDSKGLAVIDISDSSSPSLLTVYETSDAAYDVSISKDGSKAYIADDGKGLSIIDLSKSYILKKENFGTSNLELDVSSNHILPVNMNITTNRNDIVSLGSYDNTLTSGEYKGNTILVPINSILNQTGLTIFTITLNDGVNTSLRTIYLNVYD